MIKKVSLKMSESLTIRFPLSLREKLEKRFPDYGRFSYVINMALGKYFKLEEEKFDLKSYGKTKTIQLTLNHIEYSQLKEMSRKTNISMAKIILRACEVVLESK